VSPGDIAELTTLRRAFHTLKGSSRMVGLNEFGEAGWSMEQVLNTWLADQKPAHDELRVLAREAMEGFARWIEDIAGHRADAWKSGMFRGPADAMRLENRLVPITLPGEPAAEPVVVEPVAIEPEALPALEIAEPAPAAPEAAADELPALDISFDEPAVAAAAEAAAEQPAPPVEAIELSFDIPEPAPEIATTEITEIELTADFDFPPAAVPEEAPAPVPEPAEIEGIDFASLSAVSVAAEPEPRAEPEPAHPPIAAESDEQVKVIGPLRIGIPLYNVYLNEADEWSRRLATELAEWALELHQPLPDSPVGLAHALSGSSATVGFLSLSDIARALENALEHTQRLAWATPQHGKAFTDAADEIRRLLHQFAAGFLKEPNPAVMAQLDALKSLDIPVRAEAPDTGADQEFEDFEFEMPPPPAAEVAPPAIALPELPAIESVAPVAVVPAQPQLRPVAAPAAPVARAAAVVAIVDDEDDIDAVDAVDPDLFPIFEEEAQELLPQLGGALRQWSARPDNRSARNEVLRALHTLKGSARLAGALRLGELAHRMESHVESLNPESATGGEIDPVVHRFDVIQASFDALRARVAGGEQAGVVPEAQPEPIQQTATAAVESAAKPAPVQLTPLQVQAPQRALIAQPAGMQLAPRAQSGQAVRVRSQLLDRLMNQAGEVMITRSRLEQELRQLRGALTDLTGNLDRLRTQLRDIELQAETQMQSRLAQQQESGVSFDPLEFDRFTRVQELTRMMAESVNDVATVQRNIQRVVESTEDDLVAQARQTRELQRDLLRTRMVEFEGISDRLYRVVRFASKETAKQVKLDITGGSIEMDRGVLDRMTPAFEHLLRNCVAHGVEDPATRTAAGKDASGSITIHVSQEGNDVSVEFRDDGAGLNLSRIRDKAREQGLVAPNQEVTDAEAAQLIFMPGFSTASQVTELAGRGIGMDVVRAEVNALGGRIETATSAGQGTSFKLVLPLTTAVTQVVMIRAGHLSFGVPANLIEIVRRATAKEVDQSYNSGAFEHAGEQLPFFWCGALLQASTRSTETPGKTLPVVIFRSAAQRVAVHVDEILGNQEVVVKNLGPQLARLPGLAGMTLLASGAVVLIYNPVALSAVYGEQARAMSADHAQPEVLEQRAMQPQAPAASAVPQIPLVLVVDDSITVRRVTQRLLQREGYRVALAADGLQALERLAEELPAVVLSDIEMPRMDGFDLARNIRADERTKDLPIVMITSRIAEKHREHAKELGVDHYLGKPYSEEELLSLVKHYSSQTAMA
jgi:chemosensory pili system protein ChpA (sensor histidine kinase/response regulator)